MNFVHFVERFIPFLLVTPPSATSTPAPLCFCPCWATITYIKQPRVPLRSTLGYVLLRLQRDSMFGVHSRLLQSTQKNGHQQ